ncbi:MAG: tryptophan synthase subunit alpha [Firmicutes bacterium]|nr:tryptophan synthase subunit alpha [Bacillota bacterium]
MLTIEQAFLKARQEGRAALIPYVTAGFPSLQVLPDLIRAMADGGADIIEVGIPFSDPLADGPMLQYAATRALEGGTKIPRIFDVLQKVTADAPPIIFLTYINPVYHRGIEWFAEQTRNAGVQGMIIPDLPWIEGKDIRAVMEQKQLAVIPLVAPTSTDTHIASLTDAHGFVYGVSVTGVTGMREFVDGGVRPLIDRVRQHSKLPVAIGFGISTPDHAREVGKVADGVIVGSALVKRIRDHAQNPAGPAREFVQSLRQALE